MSEKITYQELINSLSRRTGKSKLETDTFVHAFVGAIEAALTSDGHTHLANFGKWEKRHYASRPGRHPQTGERIQIPAHERVVFKPYKALKETVNSDFLHLDARPISSKPDSPGAGRVGQASKPPESGYSMDDEMEPLIRVRERPPHAGPPPFFIELDEQEPESSPSEGLIQVRPSPLSDRQGDTEKS